MWALPPPPASLMSEESMVFRWFPDDCSALPCTYRPWQEMFDRSSLFNREPVLDGLSSFFLSFVVDLLAASVFNSRVSHRFLGFQVFHSVRCWVPFFFCCPARAPSVLALSASRPS